MPCTPTCPASLFLQRHHFFLPHASPWSFSRYQTSKTSKRSVALQLDHMLQPFLLQPRHTSWLPDTNNLLVNQLLHLQVQPCCQGHLCMPTLSQNTPHPWQGLPPVSFPHQLAARPCRPPDQLTFGHIGPGWQLGFKTSKVAINREGRVGEFLIGRDQG